jgi:hypothetical protein
MLGFGSKKADSSVAKQKKTAKDYEQMGRELEALYYSVNPSRGTFYKAAFLKGILTGVGGVIGATVVIAIILWLMSLFNDVPLIGDFIEAIQRSIEQGSQH